MTLKKEDLKDTYITYDDSITEEVFNKIIVSLKDLGLEKGEYATTYSKFKIKDNHLFINYGGLNKFTISSSIDDEDRQIQVSDILGENWNKKKYTIDELKTNDKLIIYLDSKEEWERLSKIVRITYLYYGSHCYRPSKGSYCSNSTKTDPGSYDSDSIILTINDIILPEETKEKWFVGSYVVFLEDNLQRNNKQKGSIEKIHKRRNNSIDYSSSYSNDILGTNSVADKLKWFATKSEAEDFAKTLKEPIETKQEYDLSTTITRAVKANDPSIIATEMGLTIEEIIDGYSSDTSECLKTHFTLRDKTMCMGLGCSGDDCKFNGNKYTKEQCINWLRIGSTESYPKLIESQSPDEFLVKCIESNGIPFVRNKVYKAINDEDSKRFVLNENVSWQYKGKSLPYNGVIWEFKKVENKYPIYECEDSFDDDLIPKPVETPVTNQSKYFPQTEDIEY